mgnify:FL=1
MSTSELKDLKLVEGYVVLRKGLGEFLEGKLMRTAKEKIATITSIYLAERVEENPLVLEESDYNSLLYAVLSDKYVVDTGNYYINVGKPVGREEFLSLSGYNEGEQGERTYSWDFESFNNAKLFTKEEIETIVPEPYRNSMYVVMENIAKMHYGGVEL